MPGVKGLDVSFDLSVGSIEEHCNFIDDFLSHLEGCGLVVFSGSTMNKFSGSVFSDSRLGVGVDRAAVAEWLEGDCRCRNIKVGKPKIFN